MFATATRPPDHSSAVSVDPMPSRPQPDRTLAAMPSFADWTALAKTPVSFPGSFTARSNFRTASMTVALATSPAAWPPIPSATAHSQRPTYAESSFRLRTNPMSVANPTPDDMTARPSMP
jgi:hypothetical protein